MPGWPSTRPAKGAAPGVADTGRQVLVASLFLVAEAALAAWVIRGSIGPLAAALVHAALVTAAGFGVLVSKSARDDLRFPLLLILNGAALGPIGAGGVLLCLLLYWRFGREATSFEDWYARLFPEEIETSSEKLLSRIEQGSRDSSDQAVVPFIDVLAFGSREQKQAMIALITSRFRPEFAPVLRKALQDSNHAIRVQAATAMTRVENGFLETSIRLHEASESRPGDSAVLLELARHFDSYAFTGILDGKREHDNREKAAEAYGKYLEMNPEDAVARTEAARLLIRKGGYTEAKALLEPAVSGGTASPQMVLWYLECLFRLGRHEELRSVAASRLMPAQLEQLPPEASEIVRLWTTDAVDSACEVPA
jgi:tetratricopeptide (TPR) repeat protein